MSLSSKIRVDIANNRRYCTFAEKSTARERAELFADISVACPSFNPVWISPFILWNCTTRQKMGS